MPAETSDRLKKSFLEGMSYAANTVSIVATDGKAGRAGVTVSAMASVSVDGPSPALLVCIHRQSPACHAILENGVFSLNVLRESQSSVSDAFAGRVPAPGGDKFNVGQWQATALGAPRLGDALVSFSCALDHSVEIGSHHVLFGAVNEVAAAGGERPLIYANRAYGVPAALQPSLAPVADAGRLRIAAFAPFAPYVVPSIVARLTAEMPDLDVRVSEGDDGAVRAALTNGAADVGVLYDFGHGPEVTARPLATLAPYVLLPARHPLVEEGAITLDRLASEPLVLLDIAPSRD
ncbi:MAG: flavin reductase, partial [Pseudomonadota bacterium]